MNGFPPTWPIFSLVFFLPDAVTAAAQASIGLVFTLYPSTSPAGLSVLSLLPARSTTLGEVFSCCFFGRQLEEDELVRACASVMALVLARPLLRAGGGGAPELLEEDQAQIAASFRCLSSLSRSAACAMVSSDGVVPVPSGSRSTDGW